MEDKHIYSTSFLSKLQDKVVEFAKEIQSIVQSLVPKGKKKQVPTVSMEPLKKEIPQTPVTTFVTDVKTEKPKIKISKEKKPKKVKVKKVHFRKFADEHLQRMLVISLIIAIVVIFGLGIYLTHKDSFNF